VKSGLTGAGGLVEVGDAFELDFLSVEDPFDFLTEALAFGAAGRVFSVSLISPSSRLSSVSKAVVFVVGKVAVFSIADGGAVVDGKDSSSP
jgi:hypothetical protein